MKRKLLFTMVLAVLKTTVAEARKFKVAVAMAMPSKGIYIRSGKKVVVR